MDAKPSTHTYIQLLSIGVQEIVINGSADMSDLDCYYLNPEHQKERKDKEVEYRLIDARSHLDILEHLKFILGEPILFVSNTQKLTVNNTNFLRQVKFNQLQELNLSHLTIFSYNEKYYSVIYELKTLLKFSFENMNLLSCGQEEDLKLDGIFPESLTDLRFARDNRALKFLESHIQKLSNLQKLKYKSFEQEAQINFMEFKKLKYLKINLSSTTEFPDSLETLFLDVYSQNVGFPKVKNLRFLQLDGNHTSFIELNSRESWRFSRLEDLEILRSVYDMDLKDFPNSILRLSIETSDKITVHNLPNKLEKFKAKAYKITFVEEKIHGRLRVLDLTAQEVINFPELPISLDVINLNIFHRNIINLGLHIIKNKVGRMVDKVSKFIDKFKKPKPPKEPTWKIEDRKEIARIEQIIQRYKQNKNNDNFRYIFENTESSEPVNICKKSIKDTLDLDEYLSDMEDK